MYKIWYQEMELFRLESATDIYFEWLLYGTTSTKPVR
jgi:hypothetical protein